MFDIEANIPLPVHRRDTTLQLAQSLYNASNVGKRTAAREAVKELGLWSSMIEYDSAIDYLRQRIVGKQIQREAQAR